MNHLHTLNLYTSFKNAGLSHALSEALAYALDHLFIEIVKEKGPATYENITQFKTLEDILNQIVSTVK